MALVEKEIQDMEKTGEKGKGALISQIEKARNGVEELKN